MPLPATITGLYRYPVKGLTPEALQTVALQPRQTLPADRRYAIENGPSGFDPTAPTWLPKTCFLMLQRDEWLAALEAHFDDATSVLTLKEDGAVAAEGNLEAPGGRAAIERFLAERYASRIKGTPKVLVSPGHSFSDVAKKVVSIINRASLAAIENMIGLPVYPLRFRANLYVKGWPAWHEASLVGETLAISTARLHQGLQLLAGRIVRLTRRIAECLGEPGDHLRIDHIVLGQTSGRQRKAADPLGVDDPNLDAGLAQHLGPGPLIAAARLHHRLAHLVLAKPGHQLAVTLCSARVRLPQRQRANARIHLVLGHIDAHDNHFILCHHPLPSLLGSGSKPLQLFGLRKTPELSLALIQTLSP